MSTASFASLKDYYAADPRRRPKRGLPQEYDLGMFSTRNCRQHARVTWVRSTNELIAVIQGKRGTAGSRIDVAPVDYAQDHPLVLEERLSSKWDDEGPVEVLGHAASLELAKALLWSQPDDAPPTIEDLRQRLANAPTTPPEIRKTVRRWRAAVEREQEEFDQKRRASYEVVQLDRLPPDRISIVPSRQRPCGCRLCEGNWRAISAASVTALDRQVDPIDQDAVFAFAKASLPSEREQLWLASLFLDPILVAPGEKFFTNGRHRTHAMRMTNVVEAVIYTKAGERAAKTQR